MPTLGGNPVTVKVPPGTPHGRTFRVKGKGTMRRDGTRGDLLVTVDLVMPDQLDEATKAALEKLRSTGSGDDVRARLVSDANAGAASSSSDGGSQ